MISATVELESTLKVELDDSKLEYRGGRLSESWGNCCTPKPDFRTVLDSQSDFLMSFRESTPPQIVNLLFTITN